MDLIEEAPRAQQRAGDRGPVGRAAEVVLVEEEILGAVLHHQHRHLARGEREGPGRRDHLRRVGRGLGGEAGGQDGGEGRAHPRRALGRHRAAQGRGQAPHQRQAEPGAAHAALDRILELAELFEDALLVRGGDADAGIRDREGDQGAGGPLAGPPPAGRALTRISPRSVNLSAFESRLRRIWETLPSSVYIAGSPSGSSKTRFTWSLSSSGRSMPRSAAKRSRTSNSAGRTTTLPASTLARSSRSFTTSVRSSAA